MFCKKCGKEIEDDSEFCVYCGTTVSVTGQKDEKDPGSSDSPVASTDKYPMALPKGSVLAGQYIIDKPIGQGGFGITYIAEDHTDGKKVAVKEYYPETLATRQDHTKVIPLNANRNENYKYGMDCFLQEAKTLSNFIDNEDIVRVYSYFEENNTAYFVMEYIEGVSLADYIRGKGGKISFDDACHTLFPIMDALAAVHEKGIIHRDISPDNIFVTWEGHVKLIDFGAARYSIGDRSMSLDVILKHGFAPKEQYSRHGRQGAYTDIYALAATFYYAITGKRPQDSVDRMDKDLLISPSAAGAGIGPNAEKVLLHALAVQPEMRFQKMADFKQAMVEAVKQDNSPDAVQNSVPADDERTLFADDFAPQSVGMSMNGGFPGQNAGMNVNGGFSPQNVGTSVNGGFPGQNTGMNMNGGFPPQNVGTSVNGGFPGQNTGMNMNGGFTQQDVGVSVSGGFPGQNTGMNMNGSFTGQDVGVSMSGGFTQQNVGMTVNNGYPQQIPVTQMNTGVPNTGWNDPSAYPQGEKKKSKLPLVLIIAAAVTVVLVAVVLVIVFTSKPSGDEPDEPLIAGRSGNEDPTPTKEKNPTPTEGEKPTPTEGGGGAPGPVAVSDFETAGYLMEGSSSTYYYYVVKNNSSTPVAIKGNAVAYDSIGNMLSVDDDTINVLGGGESSIMTFYFSGMTGIDHVDCQLLPTTDISYAPFIGNIRLDQSVNEDNVVITATNTGSSRAVFMEVHALFFNADGTLVDAGTHYIVDGEGQLADGAKRSVEVDCSDPFDHVECYLTGYSDGEPADRENAVSDSEFTVKEYKAKGNYGGTNYYLTIRSNSDKPVQMNVNMTAYDASGKAVGAGDSQIEILAKGETSIADFSFSSEDIDHVEYTMGCGTKVLYDPVIGDLEATAAKADGKAIVTVKNNGNVAAEFVKVYVLFFDANGEVVYSDNTYVTDDDYQIKPGAELSEEVRCRVDYDHTECYISARADKSE